MIRLKDILNESMSKNKVQDIIDIPDMRGEESESTKAQWVDKDNTIYIYYPNMMNEEDVIRSVLHEFEHTHQDAKKNEKYRELGYDDNPYEIAARKAEKKWKQYL